MKFSLSWLETHLDYDAPFDDLLKALTDIGIEVEGVDDPSKALGNFVIATITATKPHPNADRLKICTVNIGDKEIELVCGDPAARADMTTVFAPVGTYVPGLDITLKKAKIRDIESCGMLCSEKELGLAEDSDGIMDLDKGTPGESIVTAFDLNDPVIEVAVTPNRPDWLGVRGIARDLAAAGFGTLKTDTRASKLEINGADKVDVDLQDQACRSFSGRVIKNVKNGPSPEWLQKRLLSIGLRPISALVDITNFVTFDRCRPLHAFDLDKLKGKLVVRSAKDGEELVALDNKTYSLKQGMTVIADDSGVIGIAGIIGGESTACDENTKNVLLECADFDPISVAKTGRLLNLISDARYRFERGVDPASVADGNALGTALIQEICGGEASEISITGKPFEGYSAITLPLSRILALTAVDVPYAKAEEYLTILGCDVTKTCNSELDSESNHKEILDQVQDDILCVTPPSWRGDIEGPADLIEEILRLHGYDHIPETDLPAAMDQKPLSESLLRRGLARQTAVNRGFDEVVSYAFLSEDKAKVFGGAQPELILENPISVELSTMRPSLLPNLLDAASKNAARGFTDLSLFEVGATYHSDTPDGQFNNIAAIRTGKTSSKHWAETPRAYDLFDIKADFLALAKEFGFKETQMQLKAEAPSWYHPGRSGTFYFAGKNIIGVFGEIHPKLKKQFGLTQNVMMCEIYLDSLPKAPAQKKGKLELSPYQAVNRDFAFILDKTAHAENLIKTVQNVDKKLVQHVDIFDLYEGDKIDQDKKSLALSVKLQALDRTLSEEEIEGFSANVIKAVADKMGGVIRDH